MDEKFDTQTLFIPIFKGEGLQGTSEIYRESYQGVVDRLFRATLENDRRLESNEYRGLWKRLIEELEEDKGGLTTKDREILTAKTLYHLGKLRKGKIRRFYEDALDAIVYKGTSILYQWSKDYGYRYVAGLKRHIESDINEVRELLSTA
jgi:hypothetical protein